MKTSQLSKVALATAAVIFSGATLANGLPQGGAFSGSGQDKLVIKGKLKKTNSCDVSLNKGGLFDVGTIEIKDKLDENGGVFASKKFKVRIKCDYPSAVVLDWDSSKVGTPTYFKNFSRTLSANYNLVYNTRIAIEGGDTVSAIGAPTLNVALSGGSATPAAVSSGVSALSAHSGARTYLNKNNQYNKLVAFREGTEFSMYKKYVLPITIELHSQPFSNWINDMPSGKLNLNEQITIKSYII